MVDRQQGILILLTHAPGPHRPVQCQVGGYQAVIASHLFASGNFELMSAIQDHDLLRDHDVVEAIGRPPFAVSPNVGNRKRTIRPFSFALRVLVWMLVQVVDKCIAQPVLRLAREEPVLPPPTVFLVGKRLK
jgi:hypothetical protein